MSKVRTKIESTLYHGLHISNDPILGLLWEKFGCRTCLGGAASTWLKTDSEGSWKEFLEACLLSAGQRRSCDGLVPRVLPPLGLRALFCVRRGCRGGLRDLSAALQVSSPDLGRDLSRWFSRRAPRVLSIHSQVSSRLCTSCMHWM